MDRRNLDAFRLAMVALDLLPMATAEALARKAEGGREAGRGRPKEKDWADLPSPIASPVRARDEVAAQLGVSGRQIAKAKRVQQVAAAGSTRRKEPHAVVSASARTEAVAIGRRVEELHRAKIDRKAQATQASHSRFVSRGTNDPVGDRRTGGAPAHAAEGSSTLPDAEAFDREPLRIDSTSRSR